MPRPIPESQFAAILAVLAKRPNGATLIEVAAKLHPPPPLRNVQRWLAELARQNRIVRAGSASATRYRLPVDSGDDAVAAASPEGAAIQRLVNQPLGVRAIADYRRVSLESYRPNQTWYIPAEVRARFGSRRDTPTEPATGAPVAPAWREPTIVNRILVDLAWRSGWLEVQGSFDKPAPLSMPDVTAWLTQPESINARPEVQLMWNHRAALNVLTSRGTDAALTHECLMAVYAALGKRLGSKGPRKPAMDGNQRTDGHEPTGLDRTIQAAWLRRESVTLARTTYLPPAEPWVIEGCFNQILGWASAIADPIEQAFFVFVHLLYLQPFATLNASMACLAVNIPLLRAGLQPVTFAGIRGADLLDGMRGVWELNRTELLRDVFIAAYDECRPRYQAEVAVGA